MSEETTLNEILEILKRVELRLTEIEKNTRDNTEVAQKMSRYTAVLDFAETKLKNSSFLGYFMKTETITDIEEINSDIDEPNSDFE